VPAFPDWVWRTPAWSEHALASYRLLAENAVEVPGPDSEFLAELAREHQLHLAIGVDERLGSTLYNTLLLFGPDGTLLNHHRKLMPTGGERLVWGYGDGSSLNVVDTSLGRVGGLICWENYMPLARATIYAQDVQLYLAPTWDTSDVWVPTLQHIAKEGRTYVIGSCQAIHSSDLPAGVPGKDELYGDEWLARGLSTIVAPGGHILAGPLEEKEGLVTATIDVSRCTDGRGMFDPTGHYARPDVFRLEVDRSPRRAVK
jgi:nitrilase